MPDAPQFRTDLYRGTAADYDLFRVPYPPELVEDLIGRTGSGGRLVDLACGPGRVTLALAPHFSEVIAVDQEPESVEFGRGRGVDHIRWLTGRAEDLTGLADVQLVTIGDAFHRLDRRRVAALVHEWLQPGGHLALLWTTMPWGGTAPWQRAALEWAEHWMHLTGSIEFIPADLADSMADAPTPAVLADAGLEMVGTFDFSVPRNWTVESLVGFAHSTSILSRAVLGARQQEFECDLATRLHAVEPSGRFEEVVGFSYELAVKPRR